MYNIYQFINKLFKNKEVILIFNLNKKEFSKPQKKKEKKT